MNTKARPTIFSPSHVTRAMADNNFYTLMPEFLPVKKKMEAAKAPSGPGCTPCRKRRAAASFASDFLSIMGSLPDSALTRMKRYFGAERLLVRTADRRTGKMVLKEV